MESFSLLKYWRGGGGGAGSHRGAVSTTTIAAATAVGEDAGGVGGDDDDASFFDLEFAVPADESAASDAEEDRVEFDFAVAGAAGKAGRPEALSPASGDGKDAAAEHLPAASFLRPATKFRVLLLKLRRPKPAPPEGGGGVAAAKLSRFLIKFRVDDAPITSLFTRDNSARAEAAAAAPVPPAAEGAAAITAEERRFAKEVVLKYLNKIKPLYVKVSRRYGERLRFASGDGEETDAEPEPTPSPSPSPSPSPAPSAAAAAAAPAGAVVVACGVRAPRGGVPAGLRQVCKRLGKSRSASAAVAAAPSPPPPPPPPQLPPQRRDDSLLQLQDGIQSAIAHCKRSFNASKGSESPLLRSMSDPGDDRQDSGDDGA